MYAVWSCLNSYRDLRGRQCLASRGMPVEEMRPPETIFPVLENHLLVFSYGDTLASEAVEDSESLSDSHERFLRSTADRMTLVHTIGGAESTYSQITFRSGWMESTAS